MNKLLLKKELDIINKTKALAVSQKFDDDETITHICKSFVYKIFYAPATNDPVQSPDVVIRKIIDKKRRIEKFSFYVTGSFYMNHKRLRIKVGFRHTLDIDILWKRKEISSKKSAILN